MRREDVVWCALGDSITAPPLAHTPHPPQPTHPPPIHCPATGSDTSANLLGVQEAPKAASDVHVDFSNLLGPLFFTWVVQMLLPIFLMQLVYEKEKRLRMMMKMHGLGDGAYWLVTYTWFAALYVVYMAIFVAFGSMIGLTMFTNNSLGVQVCAWCGVG